MRFRRRASVLLIAMALCAIAPAAHGQVNPLDFVTITPITDNDPGTNELGRDNVSINSTPFKNESLITIGSYQFTTAYRDDGKLMVMRRDLTAPVNNWDIRVTAFTAYNINDAHDVPVIGIDGDGNLHLAWGTHANPLLYTRSATALTSGQPLSFIGDTVGNSGAINTMTGTDETKTTYPNFIRIPGSDDLLFNYRTGGSGNGTYRLSRWNDATDTWSWADRTWIKNTDSSGQTYNAYPHNMSYDSQGGLHASWTFRYNSTSPTGQIGYQTNHNLFYAYSPDNGVTWYKDINATIPYPVDIDQQNAQVIIPIPEGSSLINTGTQAVDAHDRPAIATWWAPRAHDPAPDHRRQYMYAGNNGTGWFTSQITHRRSDDIDTPVPESQLGVNHMGRPQIVFDDYNRAYVVYKDDDNGGGVTVAYSQAESRDDWEFIKLTTTPYGRYEPTLDRALWESSRQAHILIQTIDGSTANGGSPLEIVEWNAASAMGRVLKWTGQNGSTWDTSAVNFTDLGTPDHFDSYDNVTFDDAGAQAAVHFAGNVEAGKVVVDSSKAYTFAGPGALTGGSLAVVGGGSLELATGGNTYAGQTRVSHATLRITGEATAMTSHMVAADGGTLIMDSSDAATMASSFEIWPTGVLEIGSDTTTGNPFPDNPTSIINDGLIRVKTTETLKNVEGLGAIEAAAGTITLQGNGAFSGTLRVKSGAAAVAAAMDGLGSASAGIVVEDGGQLRMPGGGTSFHRLDVAGDGGGAGAVQIAPGTDVTLAGSVTVHSTATTFDAGAGATAAIPNAVTGAGGLAKQGPGTLRLEAANTYAGPTVVRGGTLIVDKATGYGETIVESGGVLEVGGTVRGDLNVLGGSVVRLKGSFVAPSNTLFLDDFSGSAAADLNGTTPDATTGGATWVAVSGTLSDFNADGSFVGGESSSATRGGCATLAFTPASGQVYTLDASLTGVTGNSDWIALGFASGQSTAASSNSRFITGTVVGKAWMLARGDNSTYTNTVFLGTSGTNGGIADGTDWAGGPTDGGDIDMRIVLDTTGGAGAWTATWYAKRPTDADYAKVRDTATLLNENITSLGFAVAGAGIAGTIESFSLEKASSASAAATAITVAGDYTQAADAALQIVGDLAAGGGATILGDASLDGVLDLSLLDISSASLGDTMTVITASSVTGRFAHVANMPVAGNLGLSVLYGPTTVELHVSLLGDANGDDVVDAADFITLKRNFGTSTGAGAAAGDSNASNTVNWADLSTLMTNMGAGGAGTPATTPEPATLGLLAIGALAIVRRRRSWKDSFVVSP